MAVRLMYEHQSGPSNLVPDHIIITSLMITIENSTNLTQEVSQFGACQIPTKIKVKPDLVHGSQILDQNFRR